MRILAQWWRRPAPERWRLLVAAVCLTLARLALECLPFRWLMPLLKNHDLRRAAHESNRDRQLADEVRRALKAASGRLPWQSTCLAKVLAGRYMLVRGKLPATVFLGVQRSKERGFSAHAWLRSGGLFIAGEEGHEQFSVLEGPAPEQTAGDGSD